ncbi:hypothetical protein ACOMHN_021272 [Nucella lapillus]
MWQRLSPRILQHNDGGLRHGYKPCCNMLIQCFHTHTDKNQKRRTGEGRTVKEDGERDRRQTHRLLEEDTERYHSGDESQESWSLDTEEDVRRLSQEVVTRAGKKDVMVMSVPLPQLEQVALGLHSCGWRAADILSLLCTHPSLLHRHRSILPTTNLLLNLGFKVEQVVSIFQDLPVIVTTSKSQIHQTMDALRTSGFGENTVFRLVSHNPSLLLVPGAALCERVLALRQLFKSADVITLGMKCPRLLSDAWKEIQAKFDYVFHEMGITQKQMVHAALFNHSLTHVKQRHTFLVRAGFFTTAKRKEGERNPNATLDQIITSSDKTFCRKFGNFKVAEYGVFCLLFDKEQAAWQDSDSDDESLEEK